MVPLLFLFRFQKTLLCQWSILLQLSLRVWIPVELAVTVTSSSLPMTVPSSSTPGHPSSQGRLPQLPFLRNIHAPPHRPQHLPEGVPSPAEVLICSGSVLHATDLAPKNEFLPALNICAPMFVTKPSDLWQMEDKPIPLTVVDMLLLPNGEVLLTLVPAGAAQGGTLHMTQCTHPCSTARSLTQVPNGSQS